MRVTTVWFTSAVLFSSLGQVAQAAPSFDLAPIATAAAGQVSLCAIQDDSTVRCAAGDINDGGTLLGNPSAVPADLGKVVQLSVGWEQSACAVKADETLRCWGDTKQGKIEVPQGLPPIAQVAAGYLHTCALSREGAIFCWGYNRYGQATVPALPAALRVAVGWTHTCAVLKDYTVRCWGDNEFQKVDVPVDLGQVIDVQGNYYYTCALQTDHRIRCWGADSSLGGSPYPAETQFRSFVLSGSNGCGVTMQFTVTCWGRNYQGRITVPSWLTNVSQVVLSDSISCALTFAHRTVCWGQTSIPEMLSPVTDSQPMLVPATPGSPAISNVVTGDRSLSVTVQPPTSDGGLPILRYRVQAFPGGNQCFTDTSESSCRIDGLDNRVQYVVQAAATNAIGEGAASRESGPFMPLATGFQIWSDDPVLALGSSTTLRFAQSAASASIAVTGAAKAAVTADSTGFGSATFTATKAGIQKFTATYSVKVGKKTTKYTATAQLYVPSLSGPMLKIKQGKTGKFSLQFMPPGAVVSIALSDGRTLTGIADSAGKSSFTPTFNTLGAVTYTASVAGVQVGTGGLTVTR